MAADFPRKHIIAASSILGAIFLGLLLTPGENAQANRIQANRISLPIELQLDFSEFETNALTDVTAELRVDLEEPQWQEFVVKDGDNLSTIFKRASLSANTVYRVTNSKNRSKGLLRLYPGQTLSFKIDSDGELQSLKHVENKLKSTIIERDGEQFVATYSHRKPEIRQNYSSALISSSLYRAAQSSGLSQNLIMEMANIFGGVIDFVYDVRAGDSFTLLFEEKYLDDEKIGNGAILAAQFTNRGETYTAYRYVYGDGSVGYYNEKGVSMRKAFLRAPLDFTRVSSEFNLKRRHPIFKTTRPHRGIDYAAPRGTPIYAAGEGRVAQAGYTKANGNYVVINHGSSYTTKYLHLHKRHVRKGQKVKQKQIIGTVGSTGYATGPHLHYEFLVNGTHRNPRTIIKKLPKAKSIAASEKQRFLAQVTGLQLQLAAYHHHRQLANAEQLSGSQKL